MWLGFRVGQSGWHVFLPLLFILSRGLQHIEPVLPVSHQKGLGRFVGRSYWFQFGSRIPPLKLELGGGGVTLKLDLLFRAFVGKTT